MVFLNDPREILSAMRLGVDLFVTNYPAEQTKKGYALVFNVPALRAEEAPDTPLAVDVREFGATDQSPILEGCSCYSCSGATSRGYVRHLIMAKEILGYTLLQIHN